MLAGCGGGTEESTATTVTDAAAVDAAPSLTDGSPGQDERAGVMSGPRRLSLGRAAFGARRDAAISRRRGQALTLRYPPNGRNGYVRPVAYDYLSFALCGFFNNDRLMDVDGANAAVLRHNALYKGQPTVLDNDDNYYWAIGLLFQCIEYFGSQGSLAPGRLSPEAEADSLDLISEWVRSRSTLTDARPGFSLIVKGSENHHVQRAYCCWHSSRLLAASPRHRARTYDDLSLPAQHEAAWAAWLEDWLVERTRHGLLIEYGGDAYGATTLKGLYNVAAFAARAGRARLGTLAEMFINVFWADWAQDHQAVLGPDAQVIDVVRGGAKARVYPGHEALLGRPVRTWIHQQTNPLQQLAHFYTGLGPSEALLEADALQIVCSGVLPRAEILNVFSESDTRKASRESFVRVHGRFQRGKPRTAYYLLQDEGLVRYSYREPDFVLGSIYCDARVELDWAMISSQNRWMGVVVSSHVDARVLFTCEAPNADRNYNAFWAVQKAGTLIAQKLPGTGGIAGQMSKNAGAMRIWVPRAGQKWRATNPAGWILLDYGTARVGIFVVSGGYAWVDETDPALEGSWLVPSDERTAVVMEVVSHRRMRFSVFDQTLRQRWPVLGADGRVRYTSLYGDRRLELDTTHATLPTVDRNPVDLKPARSLDSPILSATWGDPRVTFRYGASEVQFDFVAGRVTGSNAVG